MGQKIIKNIKSAVSAPKNLVYRALDIPLKPKGLVFMVTDRCNSRCMHCNIWRQKPVDNPLTAQEIEKLFSDKLFERVRYVIGTGGEPSVRNDLGDIYLALHKAMPNAILQLSTNGLLPERVIEVVNMAMENDIRMDVGVSMDGIGEKNDAIRGVPGNFEKVDRLFSELLLIKEKYPDRLGITAGIVISDLTVDSIYDVREYTRKLEIGLVEAWYNNSSFYKNKNDKEKAQFKDKLREIVGYQPLSVTKDKWLKWLKGDPIKFPCFAANTFCVVKCDGDIVPCLTLWDLKLGNVRDLSPWEVWHSEQARKVRKSVKQCNGCLNSWGLGWSIEDSYYQKLLLAIKHPLPAAKKLLST
ncbi:MAG: radical SAM protein [Sedimentisphaerales bacterium]|nr:radical SAM protein [Sedimentisphaerales bacterium]